MKRNERAEYTARIVKYFAEVCKDYEPTTDLFSEIGERAEEVKRAIKKSLNEGERNLIILYSELSSYSEVGRVLGVSKATAYNEVKRVREKIMEAIKRGV